MRIAAIGLMLLGGLLACQGGGDSLASRPFADGCWPAGDGLAFAYEASGPDTARLAIDLDFETATYGYRNLYLRLDWSGPAGQRDSLLLLDTLMDPLGNWLVEAGAGETVAWTWRQPPALALPAAGRWTFSLSQYMREDTLCGIQRVAVRRLP